MPRTYPPPLQEHTPPCSDAPLLQRCPLLQNIAPPPTLSSPLRTELCQVWALGFVDCMKGGPVTDDDTIPSVMVPHLVKLAEGCIDHAASFIAEVFTENPETIYSTVYGAGYDVCAAMNAAYGPIEINLN